MAEGLGEFTNQMETILGMSHVDAAEHLLRTEWGFYNVQRSPFLRYYSYLL